MRPSARFLVVLALLALAGSAVAQTPSVPGTLAGAWRRRANATQARHAVISAFEPRLTRFPEMMRGIARDRIAESLPMAERLEVAVNGDRVRTTTQASGHRVVVDTPIGGSTRVRLEDGDERRVVQRLSGGWLEQVFTNDDGSIRRLLSTEPDGSTLHVDYTVHNTTLGDPVRWRIDYQR